MDGQGRPGSGHPRNRRFRSRAAGTSTSIALVPLKATAARIYRKYNPGRSVPAAVPRAPPSKPEAVAEYRRNTTPGV